MVVSPDHVVGTPGEKGRVYINQVHRVAGDGSHYVQVVAPDEAVRLVCSPVAEVHPLHDLRGQVYAWVELVVALTPVPAFGFGLRGDAPESGGSPVELLLLGERFYRFVILRLIGGGGSIIEYINKYGKISKSGSRKRRGVFKKLGRGRWWWAGEGLGY